MRAHAIAGPWQAKERVMVGVFASPYAEKLIRAAFRLANDIDAEWIALYAETERHKTLSEKEKEWLNKALGPREATWGAHDLDEGKRCDRSNGRLCAEQQCDKNHYRQTAPLLAAAIDPKKTTDQNTEHRYLLVGCQGRT